MKKIGILLTVLALTVCFFGCGRDDMPATTPTGNNGNTGSEPTSTVTPTTPIVDPTMDTNIPDPTVDSNSTENGSVLDDMTTPDSNGGNGGNSGNSGTGNAGMGNG